MTREREWIDLEESHSLEMEKLESKCDDALSEFFASWLNIKVPALNARLLKMDQDLKLRHAEQIAELKVGYIQPIIIDLGLRLEWTHILRDPQARPENLRTLKLKLQGGETTPRRRYLCVRLPRNGHKN